MKPNRNFFNKTWIWIRHDAKNLHKEIIQGIKNLIYWLPIIWRDRDWDNTYIYKILNAKIEKQAKYINKHGHHLNAKRDAEVMMICGKLMKRVSEEYYLDEMNDYHQTQIEFIPIEGSKTSTLKSTEKHNNFEDYFAKYPTVYKKVLASGKCSNAENLKYAIATQIAIYNHNKARKLLFKILETKIEKWRD